MAHYAVLDENNVVIEVLTGIDEDNLEELPEGFTTWEEFYSSVRDNKTVIRTSYNTRAGIHYQPNTDIPSESQEKALRGNYAGVDYHYLPEEDVFLPPKRYDYFVPDLVNYVWKPPVDFPTDGNNYWWNDELYQADNTTGWEWIPRPDQL